MSLEPISKMMRRARSHHYAIGYFKRWNIDSLYGVIDTAKQMKSPGHHRVQWLVSQPPPPGRKRTAGALWRTRQGGGCVGKRSMRFHIQRMRT
jgi:hypothetical protein